MNTIDRTEFSVTTGISRGNEYIFVTHVRTGRQWMSKCAAIDDASLDRISTNIQLGVTKFHPYVRIASCDSRFWMPVKNHTHN